MTTIHTIGHGRHSFKDFLALLEQHGIKFVCDVRAFAAKSLAAIQWAGAGGLAERAGIGYEHLPETGGKNKPKPEDLEWGVNRIVEIASDLPTVMMCSESKPLSDHKLPRANCHRIGMLSPLLRAKGVERIVHILPNGETIEFDESAVPSIW